MQGGHEGEFNRVEARHKLMRASRTGNLNLMKNTLSLFETTEDAAKLFRKRDAEGHYILNNILLGGHLEMLEYVFD